MSVSVNQSEKLLSLDSPVIKTGGALGADSSVEGQTFRTTFDEQRALKSRKIDQPVKVDKQHSLENKGKNTEAKANELRGSATESTPVQGNRSGDVSEVESHHKPVLGTEPTAGNLQNKEQAAQLETGTETHTEQNIELINEALVSPESLVDKNLVNAEETLVNVDRVLNSERVPREETVKAAINAAAKPAVIELNGGNTLPPEGNPLKPNASSTKMDSAPQRNEPVPVGLSQEKAQGRANVDVDKSTATNVETVVGEKSEVLGKEKMSEAIAGQKGNATLAQNNSESLPNQTTNTSSTTQSANSSIALDGKVGETSDTISRSATVEVAVDNNQKVAPTPNTVSEAQTKMEAATNTAIRPVINGVHQPDKKEGTVNTANITNDDHKIKSGPVNQNAHLGLQQEGPASITNNVINEEVKSKREQTIAAQTQKVSDANIHSQSSATVDKNLNNENKPQFLNGKTDSSHFVNSQSNSSMVNANVPVEGSTANSRQSITADTTQVVDAQIKNVEKTSISQASEQEDTEEVSATNKSPLHAARWTQSIEQVQMLGKSNGLQTTIPSRFGGEQWGNAVADKVLWLSSQRIQSAEIKLDPPELGPMLVRVSVQQDQASVSFVSHHQSVREALDQNVFKLREQFGNEGLDLVDVNVSDHSSQQSMSDGGDGEFHGDDPGASSTDKELTQEAEVLELLNLVDHYV